MTRLLDIGVERIKYVIMDMDHFSEAPVNVALLEEEKYLNCTEPEIRSTFLYFAICQ